MSRERLRLSDFEAVKHRRFRKDTLMSELKDCFTYFEHKIPDHGQFNKLGRHRIVSIHGNGIELKKVKQGKGYYIEIAGSVKIVGVDRIPRLELLAIAEKIRNITIPYSLFVKKTKNKLASK